MNKYHLIYKTERKPEGISKEEVPKGFGACHAMLMASIIYPPDGSYSVMFIGDDGRPGKDPTLSDKEWFKAWGMLAKRLSESKTLDDGRKNLAAAVWEAFIGSKL